MRAVWLGLIFAGLIGGCASEAFQQRDAKPQAEAKSPNSEAYALGDVICRDDFQDLVRWQIELEHKGVVRATHGMMELDVDAGCTVWYTRGGAEFSGPILFEYEARMVKANPAGPNDRVSDMNCFWMATDPRELPNNFFDVDARTGAFETYDAMACYYVGQGGNSNTTTRFRRYVESTGNRPLLPENDLSAPDVLLTPNAWQKVQLVACGNLIEYYRDGKRLFTFHDPEPYTRGHFGIRTTWNHMFVRNFVVRQLIPRTTG